MGVNVNGGAFTVDGGPRLQHGVDGQNCTTVKTKFIPVTLQVSWAVKNHLLLLLCREAHSKTAL